MLHDVDQQERPGLGRPDHEHLPSVRTTRHGLHQQAQRRYPQIGQRGLPGQREGRAGLALRGQQQQQQQQQGLMEQRGLRSDLSLRVEQQLLQLGLVGLKELKAELSLRAGKQLQQEAGARADRAHRDEHLIISGKKTITMKTKCVATHGWLCTPSVGQQARSQYKVKQHRIR